MNILDMMNKLTALSERLDEAEETATHKGGTVTKDEKGLKHKGKYGNDYQGDDEEEEKKKAAPAEKRGRGRPKKGADKEGHVMKPDFTPFQKKVNLKPWDKAKTTKHSIKETYTTTPLPGATAIKDERGQQVATAATPQAAAMMAKGDITITDPTKKLGEEGGGVQYEMYLSSGDTKRFMATSKEEAIKKAKSCGAKSLIRLSQNFMPVGKPMRPNGPLEEAKKKPKTGLDVAMDPKDGKDKDYPFAKVDRKKEPNNKSVKAAEKKKQVEESKMSELDIDLKDKNMSDDAFKKKYKKNKADMKKACSGSAKPNDKKMSKLKESILKESHDTLTHIVNKFKHEVKNFVAGEDMDEDLYDALYDFYCSTGEMPYGTMKARTGDPQQWVNDRFDKDVQDFDTAIDEAVRPENVPAVHRKLGGKDFPVTMGQVNQNDNRSHLPNLQQADPMNPFGAKPIASPVQFENWDKQLNELLNEGMNVVANTGLGDAGDSVTISATENDAAELLALVKAAGLGMFAGGETEPTTSSSMSVQAAEPGEQGAANIDVVDDSDNMLAMIRKMTGQGEAPVQASGPEQAVDEQQCQACEAGDCSTHGAEKVVDEANPHQFDSDVDYYDAEEEEANRDEQGREQEAPDADDGDYGDNPADDYVNEKAEPEEEKEEVEEGFANDADDTFEADIDFMQNVITGGLNGQKKNQSVGNKVTTIADTPMKESTDLLSDWRRLSGIQ